MHPHYSGGHAGSPLNAEDDEVGTRYSILPSRDTTVRERWKYRARRWTFYVMFAGIIIIALGFPFMVNDLGSWFWIIHLLWFDLDVTVTKNQDFLRFFHGPSFIGSFMTAAIGTLVIARNPYFIHQRSLVRHREVYQLWIIHSLTNFLPPFLHAIDLFYNYEALRKRHDFSSPCIPLPKVTAHSSLIRQLLRMIWTFLAPLGIVIAWFFVHFYPDDEYIEIENFPIAIYMPALVVLDALAGILLLVVLISRPKPTYPPLISDKP
eukprot:Phypoly_transcript_13859.p1 GENE.Phypoly_transcript_13859~~Phypoly_transcript_13859.p1  ORF type:complete len:264 (+),score=25.28 Phypoly_transcript_13859:178-969(+)